MIESPESNRRNQWLNHHFITVESILNHNELIWSAYNEHTLTPRSIMEWFKQVSHFLQSTPVPTRPFFNQRGVGVRSFGISQKNCFLGELPDPFASAVSVPSEELGNAGDDLGMGDHYHPGPLFLNIWDGNEGYRIGYVKYVKLIHSVLLLDPKGYRWDLSCLLSSNLVN